MDATGAMQPVATQKSVRLSDRGWQLTVKQHQTVEQMRRSKSAALFTLHMKRLAEDVEWMPCQYVVPVIVPVI